MQEGEVMDRMDTQEQISALADGQLRGDAFAQAVQRVTQDAAAREAWSTYHVIGDVLRSGDLAAGSSPSAFLAGFQARLREEPVLAVRPQASTVHPAAAIDNERPAANEASWRWKLVAGFATMTAVAAVGWNLVGGAGSSGQPQLAAAPAASSTQLAAGTERGTMIRDARLDQLLAAHRQFGSATALQTSGGFLRNATFEGQAR
jgi:sigma-E factor negative regulatory protein RseA